LRRRIAAAGRSPTPLERIDLAAADQIARDRTALRSSANPTAAGFHFDYARLREGVIAAVAQYAARDVAADLTPVVLGDFNTSAEEPCKSGLDPARDAAPVMDCATKSVPRTCGDRDGYDDTHAFLTEGIVDGLRMVPLSRGIGRTQWSRNWRAFPNVPIDHIYVPRRSRRQFTLVDRIMGPQGAREGSKVYGSDHAPLVTEWTPLQ
ncbi:MAG: endonuclease/exonuclease/phosphatase family protein, partial [Pseudomonadota bacterium]